MDFWSFDVVEVSESGEVGEYTGVEHSTRDRGHGISVNLEGGK